MNWFKNRSEQLWLPIDRIQNLLQGEMWLVTLTVAVAAWLIYRVFLKKVSQERHRNLRRLLMDLRGHVIIWLGLTALYSAFLSFAESPGEHSKIWLAIASYLGLMLLLAGATVFVKSARIITFEFLFLKNMRSGVPLLLVNILTLLLSLTIAGWFATAIFAINWAPLLATSAIFSIVLGLALQDTLGNLFAGVALQFDKPYELGDWIEVKSGSDPVSIGKVEEITWRATLLRGWMDELITIPNRLMGQAQISNFAAKNKPICRAITLRLPATESPEKIRALLEERIQFVPGIVRNPPPYAMLREVSESSAMWRVLFHVMDYEKQFSVVDKVLSILLSHLAQNGISIQGQRIEIVGQTADPLGNTPVASTGNLPDAL